MFLNHIKAPRPPAGNKPGRAKTRGTRPGNRNLITAPQIEKNGKIVMSPRIASGLRSGEFSDRGEAEEVSTTPTIYKNGIPFTSTSSVMECLPPDVYLPYTSRTPKDFPMQIFSFKEFSKTGGTGGGPASAKLHSTPAEDNDALSTNIRLRRNASLLIKNGTFPDYIDEDRRRAISSRFNREIGHVTKRSKQRVKMNESQTKGRRPPTPGLPSKRTLRPTEKLHDVAQNFTSCRTTADAALIKQLDIIESEREETIARKGASIMLNHRDWDWRTMVKAMRLSAEYSRLNDIMDHAHRHVWYMEAVKHVFALGVEANKTLIYILDFVHRILINGLDFDQRCFELLLSTLSKEDFEHKHVQEILASVRHHSDVTLEVYGSLASEFGLGVPEEVRHLQAHMRRQTLNLQREEAAMARAIADHKTGS